MIWSVEGFRVNTSLVGVLAALTGVTLLLISYLVIRTQRRQPRTGKEGLVNEVGLVKTPFVAAGDGRSAEGKVTVMGEYWNARYRGSGTKELKPGERIKVTAIEPGMILNVVRESE